LIISPGSLSKTAKEGESSSTRQMTEKKYDQSFPDDVPKEGDKGTSGPRRLDKAILAASYPQDQACAT